MQNNDMHGRYAVTVCKSEKNFVHLR